MDYEKMEPHLNKEVAEKYGFRIYIPLFVLVILMMLTKIFKIIPDIGMPLMFLISAIVGLFTGRKVNQVETIQEALHSSLPVMRYPDGRWHVYPGYDTDRRTRIYRYDVSGTSGKPASAGDRRIHPAVRRRIFLWRFLCTRRAVCTGIPEYGYRIYDCGAVLHRKHLAT